MLVVQATLVVVVLLMENVTQLVVLVLLEIQVQHMAVGVLAVHPAGRSTPPSDALTKTKSWHLGNSKVYVARKHYGSKASFAPLLEAVCKFVHPAILTRRGRIKACAFFAGVWSALFHTKPAGVQTQ